MFQSRSRPDEGPFDSSTFGVEDPFTLTWLIEIFRLAAAEPDLPDPETAGAALHVAQKVAEKRVEEALADPAKPILGTDQPTGERWIPHPLPLIRIVQMARLLGVGDEHQFAKASGWFLDLFHRQLSLRGIEHGGFDPAELVFAFEGLIETAPLRLTVPIVKSFVSCLDIGRQLDPTFRAQTPFKATEAGAVHLFSSIEVFASLLRSATKRAQVEDTEFFELIKPALHDYLQWLQATVVSGQAVKPSGVDADAYPEETPVHYLGWQSEFAHTGDLSAHIWLTSQVILYLSGYKALLERSIGRAELVDVDLIVERSNQAVQTDSAVRLSQAMRDDALQLGDRSPYRVSSRLEELFVSPRLDNRLIDASYSCLLYGPPGTGKTTLARSVARALGWPLLTITTSDFIVGGEAQVEARAKRLFEALNAQQQTVIFFDEIDRLVLDRDTFDYKSQGDMLQFMTPSMLTKINDLRRAERAIFIIGTNYADRIDSAIKRAGRIDEHLLVLPPDLSRRQQIIGDALREWDDARAGNTSDITTAALAAYWRTIPEIKSAVRNAVRNDYGLAEAMISFVPAISMESYISRLDEAGDSDPPSELLEEAFLLAYLYIEGRNLNDLPRESGRWYEGLADRWTTLQPGVVRDEAVEHALAEFFSRIK